MNATQPAPMLEARGLVKRYEDGVLALDLVSFAVRAGEIYAMLGANGAGKTTTINIFLNFVEPTEGEALVDGIVTHKDPLAAKERLAYVSENVMLYPNFTAIQNLEQSLKQNRPRALIQMATGSGKTMAAITAVCRQQAP